MPAKAESALPRKVAKLTSKLLPTSKATGERPRRRDHLIEFLHLIQDAHGHLSAAHIAALAHEMRLPQTEVYETATFYAHFDVATRRRGSTARADHSGLRQLVVQMAGAANLLSDLPDAVGPGVRVIRAPCMGRCHSAPVAEVGHHHVDFATLENLKDAVDGGHTSCNARSKTLRLTRQRAATRFFVRALRVNTTAMRFNRRYWTRTCADSAVPVSTGRKWSFVRSYEGPRLMAVNGDEGEPGTFKDRHYLETDPHRFQRAC